MTRWLFPALVGTALLAAGAASAQSGPRIGTATPGFGYGLGGFGAYGVNGYGSAAPTGYGCWRPGLINGTCGYGTPGRMYQGFGFGGTAGEGFGIGGYGVEGGGAYGTGYPYYAGYR